MKSELQTLRLFSPSSPISTEKTNGAILTIIRRIYPPVRFWNMRTKSLPSFRKKLPSEGSGLAVYLDDDLSRKVYSINPTVEEWNGELWGVTELQTHDTLSPFELAELTEWISGQFSDGWGEGNGAKGNQGGGR